MGRHKGIERAVYSMLAADVGVLALFVVVVLTTSIDVRLLAAVGFPILLVYNFLFLQRKLRTTEPIVSPGGNVTRSSPFSIYACSAIFFLGTLYGLLMIGQGELPRAVLPLLIVPVSISVFCLRMARRASVKGSDRP